MAQQIINIGAAPDDGTGDQLRTSFDKCNQNFTELYTAEAGKQPLDADLTAIAALTGIDAIYYRSAANTWSPVVVSTGLAFSGGNLTSTVTSGAPVGAEYITSTADATLTAERVLTDTATVTWDRTTAGQIKANAVASSGGGLLAIQVITVSGTYTPTAGMVNCIIELVGGGGGGGGAGGIASAVTGGGGGGSGGYSRTFKTAAQIGASQSVTIGAAGTCTSGNSGTAGGDTFVGATYAGSLCGAKGGQGGIRSTTGGNNPVSGAGGAPGIGLIAAAGSPGGPGQVGSGSQYIASNGSGGSSFFGGGGLGAGVPSTTIDGGNASNYGSGGGGGTVYNSGFATGGAGSDGVVIITEYK